VDDLKTDYMYHMTLPIHVPYYYFHQYMEQILYRFIPGNSFINVEQILYNICSGELLLYTVWFLLELILCGTNIQSQIYTWHPG